MLLAGLAIVASARAEQYLEQISIVDPVHFAAASAPRTIPVRVLYPTESRGRLPVILFSHGAGLSRDHYSQLTHHWARAGFIVLQPDHAGAAIDGFPATAPAPDDLWRSRITDLGKIAEAATELEEKVPALAGRVDARRLYLAGHSYGGHSAAALMGARVWNERLGTYEDFTADSIQAAVLLALPGQGAGALKDEWAARASYMRVDWSRLHGNLLVVTGENDAVAGMMTDRDPSWHEDIYRRSDHRPMCLLTMLGVGHYLGGIVDPRRSGAEDSARDSLALLRSVSTGFLQNPGDGFTTRAAAAAAATGLGNMECRS
jgi:dienelactone hydrolase